MCADPTQPGVWWREDNVGFIRKGKRWVRYPVHLEQAILAAYAAGQHEVEGRIASAKYPHGATYSIDLDTMKQTNTSSGHKREVFIIVMSQSDINIGNLIRAHKKEITCLLQNRGITVRWNPHLKLGSPVFDRFIKAISGLPAPLELHIATRIAYHGTGKENIEAILQHGMDPSRRKSQQRDRDWYGTHIDESNVIAKGGGKNIVVFALLVDPRLGYKSGGEVITCTQSEHALPLGEISL